MQYVCLACGYEFKVKGESAWKECIKCGGDAWWEDSGYIQGTVSTPVVPSWRKYEEAMHVGHGHDQRKAADAFTQERESATKKDRRMAKWEADRKKFLFKNKNHWRTKEIARLQKQGL